MNRAGSRAATSRRQRPETCGQTVGLASDVHPVDSRSVHRKNVNILIPKEKSQSSRANRPSSALPALSPAAETATNSALAKSTPSTTDSPPIFQYSPTKTYHDQKPYPKNPYPASQSPGQESTSPSNSQDGHITFSLTGWIPKSNTTLTDPRIDMKAYPFKAPHSSVCSR